jgi:hypothetical protein
VREQWSVDLGGAGDRIVLYTHDPVVPPYASVANLVRLRHDGRQLWAADPPTSGADCWTAAHLDEQGRVVAHSWSGYSVVLNVATGKELSRTFTK